jgi:DNA polymerase III delta prime subunit
MNLPFLKKYQPKYYDEFQIEKDYKELLNLLINMDSLNILLIGNPGSGKTSLLEATVREYYNVSKLPINNMLYINNLKDQGIQYYRNEVKTFCQTPSTINGKKKFIVLDDIDVINEQSQQVFRNCIDKYSHKVNFIASCSNTQKVIESIQSRSTIIKLKPLTKQFLKNIINNIKTNENIVISEKAENFILNICNNSVRLLINYLEKFKLLNTKITYEICRDVCTNISYYEFEKYTDLWYNKKDIKNSVKVIFSIFNKGYSVMDILDCYFLFIKTTENIPEEHKYKIIKLICKYISFFYTIHEDEIELVFFTKDLISIN